MGNLWVMGMNEHVGAINEQVGAILADREFAWVSIDGGSDADDCPLDFGHPQDDEKNPAKVRLRTATNDEIRNYGA